MSFVQKLIADYCEEPSLIYEPFAGTGTTLFAADSMGCDTIYSEVNPLLQFLISTKLHVMGLNWHDRKLMSKQLNELSGTIIPALDAHEPDKKLATAYEHVFGSSAYFPPQELQNILRLKTYISSVYRYDSLLGDLLTTAVVACLLPVSYLKKQGDVRFKTVKEQRQMQQMQDLLPTKIEEIASDLTAYDFFTCHSHELVTPNAKHIGQVQTAEISTIITSPPYLNGTNYFRNTKLELWFLGMLPDKKALRTFRNEALTSGINDVLLKDSNQQNDYYSPLLEKTIKELTAHAYDARIPQMARCYFNEMSELFCGLRSHLRDRADLLIDLGDSIFSNVHIKTDDILTEVLESIGYQFKDKVQLRQRRSRGGGMLSQVLLVFKFRP